MPADRSMLQKIAEQVVSESAVLSHLGTGGFASTFKVEGEGPTYALKIIDPSLSERARVERELDALQRVRHPSVVQFQDHGDLVYEGASYTWIKMAFVDGASLRQCLAGGQVFDYLEALKIVQGVAEGAAAIWSAGTAHRDLSPGNVMLARDGRAVIVDLGLARHVQDETLTVLPTPGTPGWMSPEQVGSTPTHGDWRSDQFVIGALGYLLVTGSAPFQEANIYERWAAPAAREPIALNVLDSGIPRVVSELLERMLRRQPHRRFLKISDLLAEINRTVVFLEESSSEESSEADLYLNISQVKNFAERGGVAVMAPSGVIIDIRAGKRVGEFVEDAAEAGSRSIVDPVTHYLRSPREFRPAKVIDLPYGPARAALLGFSGDDERGRFCQMVLKHQMEYRPDAVISPYFYAGEGESAWLDESISCAAKHKELMELRTVDERSDVWSGVAVHSSWLANTSARDSLLSALTGAEIATLYLLVATNQPSFAPIGDHQILAGLRDLLEVMREAGTPVIVGKRASSGLLLLALGARGWSRGASANLMNMNPHPETVEVGGNALDRIYVPGLLNMVSTTTYVLMLAQRPSAVQLDTTHGHDLLSRNPGLEDLSTEERILLHRHNFVSQRSQVEELSSIPRARRVAHMRALVEEAAARYQALPPGRLPGEGGGFLSAWSTVLG